MDRQIPTSMPLSNPSTARGGETWRPQVESEVSLLEKNDEPCDGNETSRKKYRCHLCPYSTHKKRILRDHLLAHFGQRPHRCDECGKAFTQRSNLNRHQLTHSGDKRFGCGMCGKRFIRRSQLENHMHWHSGKRS